MDFVEISLKILNSVFLPVASWLVCGFFVMWQARKSFERREFMDRVNFSLNIIADRRLHIRTLIEKPASEVFLNPAITKLVNYAAKRTTAGDSLLPIAKEQDYWLCLNALLNEVSEKFAQGHLERDILGASSCRSETYVICLTSEVGDSIKTRKVRAMLIKKTLLENFPQEDPHVEFESHLKRIETLRQLSKEFCSRTKAHRFIEVDICV